MDLLEAIRQLEPEPFDGIVHRIYNSDHGFLETIGSYRKGGRWNREGEYGALYTSLSRETAYAEVCRQAEKRGRRPSELGRRDHVVIRIRLTKVLRVLYVAHNLQISQEELLADTESSSQLCLNIADEARRVGFEALRVPSITRSGENLVIYQDRLLPGWLFEEMNRNENIVLSP